MNEKVVYSVSPHIVFHARPSFEVTANSPEEAEGKLKEKFDELGKDFYANREFARECFRQLSEKQHSGGFNPRLQDDVEVKEMGPAVDYDQPPELP